MERDSVNFNSELILPVLSEIQRPHEEKFELWDYKDAVLIDNKVILAYQYTTLPNDNYLTNRILIARERTIPIKKEKTGQEVLYPYSNPEKLRGRYGELYMSVSSFYYVIYIGEQYKVTYNGLDFYRGVRIANITLQSTQEITAVSIDSRPDFSEYLRALNNNGQHLASI